MPKPNDTHQLTRSLETIYEKIERLNRNAESLLQKIDETGVADITRQFADAAIHAGMPANRAYDYVEEYAAALARLKRRLGAVIEHSGHAVAAAGVAVHVAHAVPHRTPDGGRGTGRVLILKD